jgi:catechol 2,3-dioxygenase-like lactoylglutathione lyase family enzyme
VTRVHHLSLGVRDLQRSLRFYDVALEPLGWGRVWTDLRPGESGQGAGYGRPGEPEVLALKERPREDVHLGSGFHLALAAPTRAAVHLFHEQALAAGGRDAGPPGPRPAYGEHYYAAFVLDPDGHRLEAVIDDAPGPVAAGRR